MCNYEGKIYVGGKLRILSMRTHKLELFYLTISYIFSKINLEDIEKTIFSEAINN